MDSLANKFIWLATRLSALAIELKYEPLFQLFSRSVAIGFKVYRELNVPGFDDTAATEKVTSLLNDLFDILNAKIPQAGIKKGSPKIKVSGLCIHIM